MKKLLSICFLSILLGLLSFSAQAQSGCGFVIKNLQPDTIEGVVQMSPDGLLPLDHTLGHGVFINPENPIDYYGNANVGRTELYELFLCNTCGLDPKTKVSLDWILQKQDQNGNWVTVNDNLSHYAEFDIYTLYPEINNLGVCNSITWLGGRVPNGFGYCEQAVAPDMFHGITCNTPVNYPGAVPVGQGTPYSVMNQLGELIPAMGMTPIYTEALDYFYLDFFSQTRTLIQIKWKEVGNYRLIVNLRERVGGTAWNNLTWNENETTDFIGGHQSCCGEILKSDTLTYPSFHEWSKEVCDNEHFTFGMPEYDFHVTMPDTNVVFGHTLNAGTGNCEIFNADSLYRFHFFVRHTPQVVVLKEKDTLCKCSSFGEEQLLSMIAYDTLDFQYASSHKFFWYYWGDNGYGWYEQMPDIDTVVGTFTYTVRQVNTYNNFNQFYSEVLDTITCTGDPVTLYVTFLEMDPPVVPQPGDVCLEVIDSNFVFPVTAQHDAKCASTTRWYKTVSTSFHNNKTEYLSDLVYTGDEFPIHLIDYAPATNIDKTVKFYAVSYDETRNCESKFFTTYTIYIHQTPELKKVTTPNDINCPGTEVTMSVKINNSPDQTDVPYTYKWNGDLTEVLNGTRVPFVADTTYTVGTGTSTTAAYPFSSEAKYNYTQQIFTASEIGGAGEITKIALYYGSTTAVTKNNVKIYLGTTTTSSFNSSNKQWITGGTLVYDGTVSFNGPAGWKEIELQNSFVYDGTQNLVVTFDDQSGTAPGVRYFRYTTTPNTYTVMRSYNSSPITATTSKNVATTRNNIKFFTEGAGYTTNNKNQTAYNQLDANDTCGTSYLTTVYVIDGNGCQSAPVEFTYTTNDTVKPVITPNAVNYTINACEVTAQNTPKYTTLADLTDAFNLNITDNCNTDLLTLDANVTETYTQTDCEKTLVRVYTVKDHCGNPATFTQTVIAHDSVAPIFRDPVTNQSPYIRMIPVRDMNCTFNAPSKAAFVHEILPVVSDNCTEMDSLWLMDHADFYWENSELFGHIEAPGTINIFGPQVGNQLTVRVIVEDKCGNKAQAMILYFNRPDSLDIEHPSITVDPANICLGETATLTFDSMKVTFDNDFTVASPMTFAWSNLENEVEFSAPNAVITTVTPTTGDKTYHFQVTVTDAYGCTATSEYAPLFVKANPNVKIVKDIRNGATEPYCPTYGVMTIEAVDAVTGTKIPNLSYTWSGESVNVNASIEDTSFISIIPTLCDHVYTAYVNVIDTIYGCIGSDSIKVWVADTAGPVYTGDVINITVERQAGCKMYVPDFIHFLNNSNITDNCYPFSAFKDSFRQEPVEGTEITEDTPVTIYVTTPCDETEYAITGKFFARIPDNMLHVSASVTPLEGCDPTEFTFTATPQLGVGTISYAWTKTGSTWTANTQVATNIDTVVAGQDSTMYTYKVTATDAVQCKATASVSVKVFRTITEIDTVTYPNTNCSAPWNGQLVVFHAPVGTHYELTKGSFYMERVSEVPGWDPMVTENTLIFDYLEAGDYLLTVTTAKGCAHTFDVTIREALPTITFNNEVTPHNPTYCTNDNGYITINAEPGYTYEVYTAAGILVASPYTGLTVGDYRIVKTSTVNRCSAEITVTINPSTTSKTFTVTATPNSLCGDVNYNGTVAFTNGGWNYTVTKEATSEVIYEGLATTLNTLAEGWYNVAGVHIETGCQYNKSVEVKNGRNNPTFNVSTTPNNYCENEDNIVNGKLTISNKQNNTTYTYAYLGTASDPVAEPVYVNYPSFGSATELAAGIYTVKAVNAENCVTEKTATIINTTKAPTASAAAIKANTSCDPDVLAYNGEAKITITNTSDVFNTYIKNYMLVFNGDTTFDISATNKTITGLDHGTYDYTVISKYLCKTTGTVTVQQYEYPKLAMHATPNTMCVGTFEHPGNGTIVMDNPYRQPKYDFSYYYSTDAYEAGTQLQVNYFDPLSYTMYHLVDTLYYVLVYDTETGCYVHDTITVPLGRDNVVATATATANKNCQAPYDGTVTVSATAYKLNTTGLNVDAVLAYQLVGETNSYTTTYQLSPNFTGVPDGTYTVNVKDTTTGCVYTFGAAVTVDKTPVDFVITPTVSDNHACENLENPAATPWDGAISITATSTIFPTAQFVYSFEGGAFSTTNSWTGLAPKTYTIVVKDNVSGCDSTVYVDVTTNNVCAPEVTFNVIGENNIPYHFCLNANPAQICAVATTTNPDCPATDYSYQWHVDCHSLDFSGPCVDVATDEVHNCTYSVTVTSLATGCKTVEHITVVIDPIHTINYLVNDMPFLDNPRTVYNCVNKDVKIGIEKNSWVEAWWTNAHVTPMPGGSPEYNFTIAANSTTPNQMYSYCVNVVDDHGCPATGVINLISKPLPTTTVYDTACTTITIDGHEFKYADGTPDANLNVHFQYEEVTPGFGVTSNDCDSITIHEITLLGNPTIATNGTLPVHFCAGTTISEVFTQSGLTITNAVDTIITLNGTEVGLNHALAYHNCTVDVLTVTVTSGSYTQAGVVTSCESSIIYNFVVSAAPKFTSNLVVEPYCATAGPVEINRPTFNCNNCSSSCSLQALILNTDHSVEAELGAVSTTATKFSFNPLAAYDQKILALVVSNSCGTDTVFANLSILTQDIDLVNKEYCEGTALDFNYHLGQTFDPAHVTAYLLYPAGTTPPSTVTTTVNYIPMDNLTLASGSTLSPLSTFTINDYLTYKVKQNGGTYGVRIFDNDLRIMPGRSSNPTNGNELILYPATGCVINDVTFNTTSTTYTPSVTVSGSYAPHSGTTYTAADLNTASEVSIKNVDYNSGNTSQLRMTSLSIRYTVPAPTATAAGSYIKVPYVPGQELGMKENGAKLFFVVTGEVCNPITTDTVTLTINPLPTVALTPAADLCLADAAADLTAAVTVANVATADQKWQYKASASATTYTDAADVNALVNAIKDMPSAQIAYHVWNDCGEATAYATVRILAPVTMSVSPATVLVCPGTSIQNALAGVTITKDKGNYTDSEVELVYKVGATEYTDPTAYDLTTATNITLIYRPKSGVVNCGQATATVGVSIKSSTFTEPTYKPACDGEPLSAFIDAQPGWSGNDQVIAQYWMVNDAFITPGAYVDHKVTDATAYNMENAKLPTVWYVWETECGITEESAQVDLFYGLIYSAPEVTVNSNITICEGNTITLAQTGLNVYYNGNEDKYDTVWTIDGNVFDFSTVLTAAEYDGKTLVVTLDDNGEACNSVSKNITLHINALPAPTITGPAKACDGDVVTFEAPAGYTSYTFNITGNYSNMTVTGNTASVVALADGVEFLTANVTVTDANGCTGSSATGASVRVTDRPEFIFYNEDGSVNDEHHYVVTDGSALNYGWMINTNCDIDDKLVFVEFDFYYEGVKISNEAIGEYLKTQTKTDEYGNTYPYVSTLTFSWLNGDMSQHTPNTSLYNYAIANPTVATAGNHFPNTNLGLSNTNVYDDLWMHFIGDRKVDAAIVPFRQNGEFKVVYRLYSTTHEDDFNHLYYEDNDHMNHLYLNTTQHLGGQNFLNGNPTITLLVSDSIIINVSGASATSGDEVVTAPELAPELNIADAVVVPDMEVWPNPAPAVTTTLKARVHNLNGNATVTLTTLTGKQVYTGDIYIDNDNYYFEFNVNSLAVGSYIMTVRTATDIITKKVIVTSLAR